MKQKTDVSQNKFFLKKKAYGKRNTTTSEEEKHFRRIKQRTIEKTRHLETVPARYTITGHAISKRIDLTNLELEKIGGSAMLPRTKKECLILYNNQLAKFLFIFDFGVIVFWNFSEYEESRIKLYLQDRLEKPLKPDRVESDFMIFSAELVESSYIEENIIFLQSQEIEERFAYSYAFAQSLKLEVFENKIERTMESTKKIPKNLSHTGQIPLRKKQVNKMIGKVFNLKASVNFLAGLLDVPDCFWDLDEIEKIYMEARNYYDLEQRIEVINSRLSLIKELYNMLNTHLQHKHGHFLQKLILFLVGMFVLVEVIWKILIKDLLKLV